jgi:hypothetical protein
MAYDLPRTLVVIRVLVEPQGGWEPHPMIAWTLVGPHLGLWRFGRVPRKQKRVVQSVDLGAHFPEDPVERRGSEASR